MRSRVFARLALISAVLLLVFSPAFAAGTQGTPEADLFDLQDYSGEELQEDLAQLKQTLETQHPMLYTDRDAWNARYEELVDQVDGGMNELEFYRLLAPLVADLNCGHTHLMLPPGWDDRATERNIYPPLRVMVRDGRLILVEVIRGGRLPAGSEIASINGIAASEIITRLEDAISSDGYNLTSKHAIIAGWFSGEFARKIQFSTEYTVEYRAPGEQATDTALLPGVSMETAWRRARTTGSNPLDSQFYDEYAILTVGSFDYYSTAELNEFRAFVDGFFSELPSHNPAALILDLRGNGGGSPDAAVHLLRYLITDPVTYFARNSGPGYSHFQVPQEPMGNAFTGALYVLINGRVFSTSGHFVSLLDYHDLAVFIGEESGGSFACTDNSTDAVLSNTGLRLYYSRTAYRTAVSGMEPGRGIMPDYEMRATADDLLGNDDSVMEFAVGLATEP